MKRWITLFLFAIAAPAAAQAPHDPARLFTHEAAIETNAYAGSLTRLALPPEVLARTRPDLSDLRIHDDRGEDVPYLIDSGARPWPRDASLPSYPVTPTEIVQRVEEGGSLRAHWTEVLRVAPPAPAPEGARWSITIGSSRPSFVRSIAVYAVEGDARTELARGSVFLLQDPVRARLSIELPSVPSAAGILEIELTGEGGYIEPTLTLTATRAPMTPATLELPLEEIERTRHGGSTWITFARPVGVAPDRLEIRTSTAHFHRYVRVVDLSQGAPAAEIGSGEIFRAREVPGAEVMTIDLRPARGERLRVEIVDGDSPPLGGLAVGAVVRQPLVVFSRPDGAATLRFGGARARPPRYDVQRFAGSLIGESILIGDLDTATLGPVRENPRFDDAPALRFAMRPGRSPELARFTHVAPLTVRGAREGLSRVRLPPSVLAAARADLADVRIVDAQGRQWPYLRAPHEESDVVRARGVSMEAGDEGSTYVVRLPVSRMRIDRMLVHTSAPYVSRPFVLRGLDDDGRWVHLATGTLQREPDVTDPLEILTTPARVSRVELLVEDGSDAPLEIDRVELSIPSPSFFLAAPDGAYRVLVGDAEAIAPEYEIARASALVLAVRAAEARVGRIAGNPAHVEPAWYEAAALETWIVWAVLLLAVLVLGVLTVRLARREEEPAAAPPAPPSSAPGAPEPEAEAKPPEPPADEGKSTKPVSF